MRPNYLLILIITLLSINAFAQVQQKKKPDTIKTTTVVQPQQSNSEIQAYRMLYETAQKSYENQKETEHWFISTVILFILFVAGSQVYFNFRFNKQTLNNITSKFDEKLATAKSEQLQKIGEQKSLLTDNLLKLFKDANQITHQAVKKLNEEISSKIAATEKYSDAMFENIKADHKNSTLATQIQFKQTSGNVYLSTKNYLSAFSEFIDSANTELNSALNPTNSLFGIFRSVGGMKDLRLENKIKLEDLFKKLNEIDKDEVNKKLVDLIKKKIKNLIIWTIDDKDNFVDEEGNILDM